MRLARTPSGEIAEATPRAKATCPGCEQEVVAKCGSIVCWHWAHRADDCDPWYEPMSAWHRAWQNRFPREQTEVVMRRDGEHHRADVVLGHGGVLELQASAISVEDIARRERFYGHMAWLFRCDWADRLRVTARNVRCQCPRCCGYAETFSPSFMIMCGDWVYGLGMTEVKAQAKMRELDFLGCGPKVVQEIPVCEKYRNGSTLLRWKHPRPSLAMVARPMFWHVESRREVWKVTLHDGGDTVACEREWDEDDFARSCARASGVRLSA